MLSVVVPCFNEEFTIAELHRRLSIVCSGVVGDSYEVILVNDGSSDGSWPMMTDLAEADPHLVCVNLARNFGHQLALSAGLDICRGERILIIDADLQDPPELLPEMFRLMDEGANVVYGQRLERKGESALKKISASMFYRLMSRLTETSIPLDAGDFRLLDRKVLNALKTMPEQYRFLRGMVAWVGFRQVALPYARAARFAGQTKYSYGKMILFALDAITGFSVMPLRVSLYVALLLLVLAFVLFGYVLYSWLFLAAVKGWASILVLFLLFGGTQLLVLSIVGEYVGRIYMQTKNRPLYIVDEVVTACKSR